jgi:hypothetical protein
MKKFLVFLTLASLLVITLQIIDLIGNYDSDKKKSVTKMELLSAACKMSSLNYEIEIRRHLIKTKSNTIDKKDLRKDLDSIRLRSDKMCDSILSEGFKKFKIIDQ